jgi:hypothetical protein
VTRDERPPPEFSEDGLGNIWLAAQREIERNPERQPPIVDVYPSRRAAFRAYAKKNPIIYIVLGFLGAIAAPVVFVMGFAALVIWDACERLWR